MDRSDGLLTEEIDVADRMIWSESCPIRHTPAAAGEARTKKRSYPTGLFCGVETDSQSTE